ncbi:MAG: hypothetical protein IJN54_14725 [Lachnospiraceae bacterium]|nr:hypothetical protein [Lachnospiraceae bacterium]
MVMKEKIADVNKTLLELLAGIFIYGIICQVVGFVLVEDRFSYSTGLWIGIITAIAAAIHIWKSLDRALDFDEGTAGKKMQAQSVIRYVIIVIIMGLTMINGVTNPLAAFLGIMGLKVAAYLQPFTHKLLIRFFRGKKPES